MTKFLTTAAAVGAFALASIAAPTAANARCYGCGVGAAVVGGIAAGAIISGAVNNGYYYNNGPYAAYPGYAYGPGYGYAPGPYYGDYGYGYRGYGGSTCDYRNQGYDRQLHGSC
jgi:hypothetical protein